MDKPCILDLNYIHLDKQYFFCLEDVWVSPTTCDELSLTANTRYNESPELLNW